jgi:hypothetical protein
MLRLAIMIAQNKTFPCPVSPRLLIGKTCSIHTDRRQVYSHIYVHIESILHCRLSLQTTEVNLKSRSRSAVPVLNGDSPQFFTPPATVVTHIHTWRLFFAHRPSSSVSKVPEAPRLPLLDPYPAQLEDTRLVLYLAGRVQYNKRSNRREGPRILI